MPGIVAKTSKARLSVPEMVQLASKIGQWQIVQTGSSTQKEVAGAVKDLHVSLHRYGLDSKDLPAVSYAITTCIINDGAHIGLGQKLRYFRRGTIGYGLIDPLYRGIIKRDEERRAAEAKAKRELIVRKGLDMARTLLRGHKNNSAK